MMRGIEIDSPLGTLTLLATEQALCAVRLPVQARVGFEDGAELDVLRAAKRQLDEYFEGKRTAFELPLAASGTEFQLAVWQELSRLEYGATCSYAELARRAGRPRAVRAVGAANRKNPHAIIVPCHRVIGADGTLTGYGGGLEAKAWLLEHEARGLRQRTPAAATALDSRP